MVHDRDIDRLDALADLMDSRFRIPGTGLRFGLDSLVGLIPGLGDAATLLPALYILAKARQMGAPAHLQLWMIANIGIDFLIGAIPLIGDLFDFGFKANRMNVAMLRRHLDRRADRAAPVTPASAP